MAESPGQERTEKGTGKRRSEARKRGQVANSREIPATLILLAALGVFHFAGPQVFEQCSALVSGMYRSLHTMRLDTITAASSLAADLFQTVIVILLPFFAAFLVAGLVGNVGQIGFEIHGEALGLKFSSMNPIAGIKRIFSLRGLVELGKSILKILFVGGIAYSVVSGYLKDFPALVRWDLGALWSFTAEVAFKIIFYVFLAMLVLSALDYLYQRWQYEESLKMTKQEVKDEHKQAEGDPKVKSRIRNLQLTDRLPPHDGGGPEGRRGHHQPDPPGHRPAVHVGRDAGPACGGERGGLHRRAHPGDGPRAQRADRREQAPGADPLQDDGAWGTTSRSTCTVLWPKCWHTSTASKARSVCSQGVQGSRVRKEAGKRSHVYCPPCFLEM